jgi:hypothetical protein
VGRESWKQKKEGESEMNNVPNANTLFPCNILGLYFRNNNSLWPELSIEWKNALNLKSSL